MTIATRRAWATIDLKALRNNLARVCKLCPSSKIIPIVKANAYGHGMVRIAVAVRDCETAVAGFGVATLDEALKLRKSGNEMPIVLLNGFMSVEELTECLQCNIEPVVHSDYQVRLVESISSDSMPGHRHKFWIKYNTGMNRLGMDRALSRDSYHKLNRLPGTELVLMSHLACADDPDNDRFSEFTQQQLKYLLHLRNELTNNMQKEVVCSLAASAGILHWPATHLDIVRPGVMLYGSSPMVQQTGEELGLQPVMTLKSRLIAIRTLEAGESIGYGATWTCDRKTRVGTVSIGYGDGYPRSAANGTPVVVKSAGGIRRTRIIGRVSMDMITIDLSDIDDVLIDDEVQLWGTDLSADQVARSAGTIAYELFCKLTARVPCDYIG
ncbi:MAG: alanine racemase [Gammaproteobacteria bacterium]|nr:alanine racemase [Gammaproteobacteria bacterium]